MGPNPEEFRYRFNRAQHVEQQAPAVFAGQVVVQVTEGERDPLHADQGVHPEPGVGQLLPQLGGGVGVAVEATLGHRLQRPRPLGFVDQIQHRREGQIQVPGVAEGGVDGRVGAPIGSDTVAVVAAADLVDMMGHRVPVDNPVAPFRQPVGVAARSTTDVCDHRRGLRQCPAHQLAGPQKLDPARALGQAVPLLVQGVVRLHGGVEIDHLNDSRAANGTGSTDFRPRPGALGWAGERTIRSITIADRSGIAELFMGPSARLGP